MFGMFKKIPALILGAGLISSSVQNEDFGYLWLGAFWLWAATTLHIQTTQANPARSLCFC